MGGANSGGQGMVKGQANKPLRLRRRRSGGVPTNVEARIQAASLEEWEVWYDTFLEARNVNEIFRKHSMNWRAAHCGLAMPPTMPASASSQ